MDVKFEHEVPLKKGLVAEKRIVYDVHNDGIDEGCRGQHWFWWWRDQRVKEQKEVDWHPQGSGT